MAETMTAGAARGACSAAEWDTRVQLAAAFRIAYHLGWNDRIVNHITARVPDEPDPLPAAPPPMQRTRGTRRARRRARHPGRQDIPARRSANLSCGADRKRT